MAATIALSLPRARGFKELYAVRLLMVSMAALITFLIVGNLVIFGMTMWARSTAAPNGVDTVAVNNFRVVDDKVWRGAAPGAAGYESLAAHGVKTIVDLRAEEYVNVDEAKLNALGMRLVRIPIRDGQTPTPDEVVKFLAAVNGTDGVTFVHCGAGVGRTGTMVAAYRVATGDSPLTALKGNLSVGPPSLEQIAFAAGLDTAEMTPSRNAGLVALSRVLDAPRRTWARLSH